MARGAEEKGQASVELVAAIPVLALVVALAVQLAVVGYSLWGAGVAARAGARAAFVGGRAERAARRSLPLPLRGHAFIHAADSVAVRVRPPSLVPGLPRLPLTARAGFGVGDAGTR
jgi:hypothetical protein